MKNLLFSITKKDLKIDYFSGTGKGGQHRNKHQNCVRIHHKDSGAISTGQSNRERRSNVKEALNNLISNPKFKLWNNMKVNECLTGELIEDKINNMMTEKNLLVEFMSEDGEWKNENYIRQ